MVPPPPFALVTEVDFVNTDNVEVQFDGPVDPSTWDPALFVDDATGLGGVAVNVVAADRVQVLAAPFTFSPGDGWHLDPSWAGVADGQSGVIT